MSPQEMNRRKKFSKASVKHGCYKTPEYTVWLNMKQRCSNQNHPCYNHYGGRGITVCERWNSFQLFIRDMGARPTSDHWIERRENNKGYEPDNCYWATASNQSRNTRRTILITIAGVTMCAKDWSALRKLPYRTIITRIRNGWHPVDAVSTSVNTKFRNKKYAKRR